MGKNGCTPVERRAVWHAVSFSESSQRSSCWRSAPTSAWKLGCFPQRRREAVASGTLGGSRLAARDDRARGSANAKPLQATDANFIAGIRLYAADCAVCHGAATENRRRSREVSTSIRRSSRRTVSKTIPTGRVLEDRPRHSLYRHAGVRQIARRAPAVAAGALPQTHGRSAARAAARVESR